MKLSELSIGQKVVIQIILGERKIEFFSEVLEVTFKGIYVTPYIFQGSPLDLVVNNKMVCNLFVNSPEDNRRRSWRSIELTTVERNDKKTYYITTNGFNNMSKQDDRRENGRFVIHRAGKVYHPATKEQIDVRIHDISDLGISFYAPPTYQPSARHIVVSFEDSVSDRNFRIKLDCTVVRLQKRSGMIFCGCRIVGDNKDYLLYGLIRRMADKNPNRNVEPKNVENTQDTDIEDTMELNVVEKKETNDVS